MERCWRDLAKVRWEAKNHGEFSCLLTCSSLVEYLLHFCAGLGDVISMRSVPAGEEEIPKPCKENKRKRESPTNLSKPKKRASQNSKADMVALSLETTQCIRD